MTEESTSVNATEKLFREYWVSCYWCNQNCSIPGVHYRRQMRRGQEHFFCSFQCVNAWCSMFNSIRGRNQFLRG